jgi:hypothetical protein
MHVWKVGSYQDLRGRPEFETDDIVSAVVVLLACCLNTPISQLTIYSPQLGSLDRLQPNLRDAILVKHLQHRIGDGYDIL